MSIWSAFKRIFQHPAKTLASDAHYHQLMRHIKEHNPDSDWSGWADLAQLLSERPELR